MEEKKVNIPKVPFFKKHCQEKKYDSNKPIGGVIVSFFNGTSYDKIYKIIEQKSPDGVVYVFRCQYFSINEFLKVLNNEESKLEKVNDICKIINKASNNNVIFNWECCSGCLSCSYKDNKTIELVSKIVNDLGFNVVFGDFSLKQLIKHWSVELLGECPFINVGETSKEFVMKFDKETLKNCACNQLQCVGELSETNEITVDAMLSTIEYTVKDKLKDVPYKLEILTVVESNKRDIFCKTIDNKYYGLAGHVLLKYPKGTILTSNGHFIELSKIDSSIEKIIKKAETIFGREKSISIKNELLSQPLAQRQESISQYAKEYIHTSAPSYNN